MKYFENIPEGFEQYNPEAIPEGWHANENTFDDDGLFHSFDDEPLVSKYTKHKKSYFYTWYSHGKVERENSKPVNVSVKENTYSTYNENMQLHSYNDEPAIISFLPYNNEFKFLWCKNGETHRDNDKPAIITVTAGETSYVYYLDGLRHRDNHLPAVIKHEYEVCLVQGILHNTEGHASMGLYSNLSSRGIYDWGLYGVIMPESVFNEIKFLQKKTNLPLWASFLSVLGLVEENYLESSMQSDGKWNSGIPASWYFKALGITDENFRKKIKNTEGLGFFGGSVFESHTESLLKFIKYEESKNNV
jgi:hypothetical protein